MNKNKICNTCKQIKPYTDFGKYLCSHNKKKKYYASCKECLNSQNMETFYGRADEVYAKAIAEQRKTAKADAQAAVERSPKLAPVDMLQLMNHYKFYMHVLENFKLVPLYAKYISLQLQRIEYQITTYIDAKAANDFDSK